jgi:small nuclear ribonucleoprotein
MLKYRATDEMMIFMPMQRPLDVLNRALGSPVLVSLKGGRELRGKLGGFDMHVNLVLEDAEELQGNESVKRYGTMIIRGDSVVFISPAE